MEINPIYVFKAGDEISLIFESPLSLFDPKRMGEFAGRTAFETATHHA